jgi:hypothetical protein
MVQDSPTWTVLKRGLSAVMGAPNMRFYAPVVNGLAWLVGTPCSCIGSPIPILPRSGRLSAAAGDPAQLSPHPAATVQGLHQRS